MAEDLPPPPQFSAVPIPDGQIDTAVGRIDELVAGVMERSGVPGIAVAVVRDGEVVLAKGYGVRETGRPEPVDADTVFQLASLSKSVGATVVANQVGLGVVRWEEPVADHLPWFALGDASVTGMLTIGDLYAHRSGLPDHAGDDLEDVGFGRREVLERLRFLPLTPFRASYAYTNFGLTAAAEAVAAASGTDWATLSETALYRPLGMERTSSRFADYMARDNRAVPHMREGDGWAPLAQRDPDAQSAAGGVSSSANDMAKWLQLVLAQGSFGGEEVVEAGALLAATSPQAVSSRPYAPDARASSYGYGIGVGDSPSGRVVFSHSGAFLLGAGTTYQIIPSARVGIVVLSNAAPVGAVEAMAFGFTDLVQFGRITRDWYEALQPLMAPGFRPAGGLAGQTPPAEPAPARDLANYAGSYANDYFGPLEVAVAGEALELRIGPEPMVFPLRHWSGDSFALVPVGENAPPGSLAEVRFEARDWGIAAVTVDVWDENGLGTFTR
jgi:CubicO group peptidase (beta-lactamase class C family)